MLSGRDLSRRVFLGASLAASLIYSCSSPTEPETEMSKTTLYKLDFTTILKAESPQNVFFIDDLESSYPAEYTKLIKAKMGDVKVGLVGVASNPVNSGIRLIFTPNQGKEFARMQEQIPESMFATRGSRVILEFEDINASKDKRYLNLRDLSSTVEGNGNAPRNVLINGYNLFIEPLSPLSHDLEGELNTYDISFSVQEGRNVIEYYMTNPKVGDISTHLWLNELSITNFPLRE